MKPIRSVQVSKTLDDDGTVQRSRSLLHLLLYLVAFFVTWTCWVLYGYPRMLAIGDRTFAYAVTNLVTRSLIWVAPVFLYIRYIDKRSPITYLKLKQNWRRGVLIGLLVSALNLVGSLLRFGLPHPAISSVTWNTILSTSLAIGFIEEVPFRGFLLQKFEEEVGYALANLLSSALFLAIHLPGWLSLRTFRLVDAGIVFVIGVVLAIVFKCSGSLWSSAIAHSSNDFYAAVLFRR